MTAYVARRLLQSVPVLVVVLVASFVLIHAVPGDPVRLMLGIHATPETVATVEADLGLDKPVHEQVVSFFARAVTGDFGTSIVRRSPVRDVVGDRILPSVYLLLAATFVSLAIAVPLGVLSAVRRNRAADHVVRLLSMVTFAMPSFWLGLMLVLLVSLKLGLLPVSGWGGGLVGTLRSLTLPALTLGLYLAPLLMRTLRSSMLEALGMEFVEAARARGFSETRVVGKHALRNSVIPLITVLSINVGFLISGTVIVENVFQIPGLGSLLVQAVLTRDFPVIQALVLTFGVMVVATNLLADLAYAAADPRIRLEGRA